LNGPKIDSQPRNRYFYNTVFYYQNLMISETGNISTVYAIE
jgi:hypothetical protein